MIILFLIKKRLFNKDNEIFEISNEEIFLIYDNKEDLEIVLKKIKKPVGFISIDEVVPFGEYFNFCYFCFYNNGNFVEILENVENINYQPLVLPKKLFQEKNYLYFKYIFIYFLEKNIFYFVLFLFFLIFVKIYFFKFIDKKQELKRLVEYIKITS